MQHEGGELRAEHAGAFNSHGRRSFNDIQQEQLFHVCQQSVLMCENQQQRTRLMYEQRRLAEIERLRIRDGGSNPSDLQKYQLQLEDKRVTLCIEVGGFEQLQASRSGAEGIAALLQESDALIRLPERDPARPEFVHQVTISGQLHEVEHVRQRIREMSTISVTMPLQNSRMSLSKAQEWLEKKLREESLPFPSLEFSLRRTSPMLDIIGAASEENLMIEAVNELIKQLYNPADIPEAQVFTIIPFAATYRDVLVGHPEGSVLVSISKETGATVHFPIGTAPIERVASLAVICSGTVSAILAARKMILGLLPVQLSLDMESLDPREAMLTDAERSKKYHLKEHGMTIRMEKSEFEAAVRLPNESPRHFITMCTNEFNIERIYEIGGHFLGIPPPKACICPLFTPSFQALLSKFIGPIYASNRVYPRPPETLPPPSPPSMPPHGREGRRNGGHYFSHNQPRPSLHRNQHHQGRGPSVAPFIAPIAEEDVSQVYAAHNMGNAHHSTAMNEVDRVNTTDESMEGSLTSRKSAVDQSGRVRIQQRDTPKHTLALKPRTMDNRQPRKHSNDYRQNGQNQLPLRKHSGESGEWWDDRRDYRSSYAQVLKHNHTGRMDPLELIARAGEESLYKRDSEPRLSESAVTEPVPPTPSHPSFHVRSSIAQSPPNIIVDNSDSSFEGPITYASVVARRRDSGGVSSPHPTQVFVAPSAPATATSDNNSSNSSREELVRHRPAHEMTTNGFSMGISSTFA